MTDAYIETTRGIRVTVRSFYLDDQSQPDEGRFVWAYRVTIDNQSQQSVQLLRRSWRITNAAGRVQRVHGDGVVGEQPVLDPGESFEYTSGTPLDTSTGFMAGSYEMMATATGDVFEVTIPTFSLDSPHQKLILH